MAIHSAATAFPGMRAGLSAAHIIIAGIFAAMAGAFIFPTGAFSIDEAIYIDMAHAMTSRGALDITPQDLPEGAPLLGKSDGLVRIMDDRIVPQYPSLYAVIAAPFYALLGVRGLILMNALAGVFSLWLSFRIARELALDQWTARAALIMLGAASIFAGYFYAIWPHMIALAFVLGGAFATLRAGAGKRPLLAAGTAGLVFGTGVGIRVDVILAALAAFFWLRLFARPSDRITALALMLGLAPGLLVNAFLNFEKFGVFNPVSYGDVGGDQTVARYAAIAIICGVLAFAAVAVDFSRRPFSLLARALATQKATVKAGLGLIALVGLWLLLPNLVRGLYVLIVDLQAFPGGERPGQIRDEYGYWTFFGLPKKALLQSMPYLPLAAAPIAAFLSGEKAARTSFLLLFATGPIAFFSLHSWHGGMSYNLRYFLPAAPFMILLAGIGLQRLKPVYDAHPQLLLRGIIAGLVFAGATYSSAALYGAALDRPMTLYPQLILGAALLAAMIGLLNAKDARAPRAAYAAAASAAAALGFAASLCIADAVGYLGRRADRTAFDRAYGEIIPQGSLVISVAEDMLTGPARAGSAIVSPDTDNVAGLNAAIDAYQRAGRCVFVHTSIAAALFDKAQTLEFISVPATASDNTLALYGVKPVCKELISSQAGAGARQRRLYR